MITLTAPPDDDLLPDVPGGFCWWYVDLVDEHGDGAVVIWGFALPFLEPPEDQPAAARPFVNLALYGQGECTAYWLREVAPEDVEALPGGWRIGGSRLVTRRGATIEVEGELELPVPGGAPVRAHLRVRGAPAVGAPAPAGPHRWSPVTAGASGELEVEGVTRLRGRAYHDRNISVVPLGRLGIREWSWARVAEPDADLVHYVCWPEAGPPLVLAVRIGADGALTWREGGGIEERGEVGARWGLSVPARLRLDDPDGAPYELAAGDPVDESPFYARFPVSVGASRGWGERVRPGEIGRWWMRPFVRMRVLPPASVLSPWFSGPRDDRVRRLWRSLWS